MFSTEVIRIPTSIEQKTQSIQLSVSGFLQRCQENTLEIGKYLQWIVLKILGISIQKSETRSLSLTLYKTQLQMDQWLQRRLNTLKLLEQNKTMLHHRGIEKEFLNRSSVEQKIKPITHVVVWMRKYPLPQALPFEHLLPSLWRSRICGLTGRSTILGAGSEDSNPCPIPSLFSLLPICSSGNELSVYCSNCHARWFSAMIDHQPPGT